MKIIKSSLSIVLLLGTLVFSANAMAFNNKDFCKTVPGGWVAKMDLSSDAGSSSTQVNMKITQVGNAASITATLYMIYPNGVRMILDLSGTCSDNKIVLTSVVYPRIREFHLKGELVDKNAMTFSGDLYENYGKPFGANAGEHFTFKGTASR